jgi:hypothetical protein
MSVRDICDIGWMQIDKGKPKPGAATSAPTARRLGEIRGGPCLRQAGLPPSGWQPSLASRDAGGAMGEWQRRSRYKLNI